MNDNAPPPGAQPVPLAPIIGVVDAATGIVTLKRALPRPARRRPTLRLVDKG